MLPQLWSIVGHPWSSAIGYRPRRGSGGRPGKSLSTRLGYPSWGASAYLKITLAIPIDALDAISDPPQNPGLLGDTLSHKGGPGTQDDTPFQGGSGRGDNLVGPPDTADRGQGPLGGKEVCDEDVERNFGYAACRSDLRIGGR
jgi:hypothetical protein